jgi:hypothetical protein
MSRRKRGRRWPWFVLGSLLFAGALGAGFWILLTTLVQPAKGGRAGRAPAHAERETILPEERRQLEEILERGGKRAQGRSAGP